MLTRSVLTLFTALMLGVTLSVPLVVTMEEGYGAEPSFTTSSVAWSALPISPYDTDSGESHPVSAASLLTTAQPPLRNELPLQPLVSRLSERPPARASPTCL